MVQCADLALDVVHVLPVALVLPLVEQLGVVGHLVEAEFVDDLTLHSGLLLQQLFLDAGHYRTDGAGIIQQLS